MSTITIKGIKPIMDDYEKRLAIYKNCTELNIEPPDIIKNYFEGNAEICKEGIIVYLQDGVVTEGTGFYGNRCFDVDLSKLPEYVTKLRVELIY